jgi:hypothetical protein
MHDVPDGWVGREVKITVFSPTFGRSVASANFSAAPAGISSLRGVLETSNDRGISGTWMIAAATSSNYRDPELAQARIFRFYSWGGIVSIEPVEES